VEALNSKLSQMNNDDGIMVVPPPKQARITEGIWNFFNEIIEKSGASVVGETGNTDIEQYLNPSFPFTWQTLSFGGKK